MAMPFVGNCNAFGISIGGHCEANVLFSQIAPGLQRFGGIAAILFEEFKS